MSSVVSLCRSLHALAAAAVCPPCLIQVLVPLHWQVDGSYRRALGDQPPVSTAAYILQQYKPTGASRSGQAVEFAAPVRRVICPGVSMSRIHLVP